MSESCQTPHLPQNLLHGSPALHRPADHHGPHSKGPRRRDLLLKAKRQGFSDIQVGRVFGLPEEKVRTYRHSLDLHHCVKQIASFIS